MPYEVLSLYTGKSHGVYETQREASDRVKSDRLRAYSIWQGEYELVEGRSVFCDHVRVEHHVDTRS